jgi:hydroxymethylbilane synthase
LQIILVALKATSMSEGTLKIGTRGSPLALVQAEEVRRRLTELNPVWGEEGRTEIVVVRTTGDRVQDRLLAEIGGKGLFTKEIEEALLDGTIDMAVHCMKDMPTVLPDGLVIPTILPREDPRDVFFARNGEKSLADLKAGAVVGTASLRRQSQVLAARPDLTIAPLRGNVETRLRKMHAGEVDATLLAAAGLIRLGMELPPILTCEEMLPAVGQGAIGLEVRAGDNRTRDIIAPLNDVESATMVTAERACLEILDGSCHTPIAGLAERTEDNRLRLRALIALLDGTQVIQCELFGEMTQAREIGEEAGHILRSKAPEEFFSQLGF